MKGQATTLAIVLSLASQIEAFTAPPRSSTVLPQQHSGLCLVPDQANQLVAAYNANLVETKPNGAAAAAAATATASRVKVDLNGGAIAASKRYLARVFHMPSVNHPGRQKEEQNRDVVYYPMVGFRFFAGIQSVFSTTSHVSCMMPTKNQKEEEVFGWFSSSCDLDLYSEDICLNPIESDSGECTMQ